MATGNLNLYIDKNHQQQTRAMSVSAEPGTMQASKLYVVVPANMSGKTFTSVDFHFDDFNKRNASSIARIRFYPYTSGEDNLYVDDAQTAGCSARLLRSLNGGESEFVLQFVVDAKGTGSAASASWDDIEINVTYEDPVPETDPPTIDPEHGVTFSGGASFIQGITNLACTISAQADEDAQIVSYQLVLGGTTYLSSSSSIAIGKINDSGTIAYAATVTDNYGKSGTRTGSITVIAYTPPSLSMIKFTRYTDATMLKPSVKGTIVGFEYAGQIQRTIGNQLNGWKIYLQIGSDSRYEAASGNATSSQSEETYYGLEGNIRVTGSAISPPAEYDADRRYNVTITLEDSISTIEGGSAVVYAGTIKKNEPILELEKFGIGLGGNSVDNTDEDESFRTDCYGNLYLHNGNVIVVDPSWEQLILSGCTEDQNNPCKVSKRNGIVYLRGSVKLTSALNDQSSVTLCTVQSGYRPPYNILIGAGTMQNRACIEIDINGNIKLHNNTGSTINTTEVVFLTASYPID